MLWFKLQRLSIDVKWDILIYNTNVMILEVCSLKTFRKWSKIFRNNLFPTQKDWIKVRILIRNNILKCLWHTFPSTMFEVVSSLKINFSIQDRFFDIRKLVVFGFVMSSRILFIPFKNNFHAMVRLVMRLTLTLFFKEKDVQRR